MNEVLEIVLYGICGGLFGLIVVLAYNYVADNYGNTFKKAIIKAYGVEFYNEVAKKMLEVEAKYNGFLEDVTGEKRMAEVVSYAMGIAKLFKIDIKEEHLEVMIKGLITVLKLNKGHNPDKK